MKKILIIGGGASGMMAAIEASKMGNQVHIYEKNEKLGKKLFITGKGRCNFTNNCNTDEMLKSIYRNPRFMYGSLNDFSNEDCIKFFESLNLKTKVERGNRAFPLSDRSSDIIKALKDELKRRNVSIHLNLQVKDINYTEDKIFSHIILNNGEKIEGDICIIATGGLSYPTTGSTGDGYRFAKKLGHEITDTYPSLVPIEVKEPWVSYLQGLSLKNVKLIVPNTSKKNKFIYNEFGEMMFTHFGITGPLVLSLSALVGEYLKNEPLKAYIDLKPALSFDELDSRILRDFHEFANKSFKNSLSKLLPSKIIPIIIMLSEINEDKKVHDITKEEREKLVYLIKHFEITLTKLRGYNEAVITRGGVNVKKINPKTMESRLVKNIYFVGEVLDLDACTGGFNLQIAWSTGYSCGLHLGD
ncbi:MAG: NAD(P)/FAD-dependent oxidoreductase [Lachnospiraceae bacterium]|jgi:predicted Rossmann fold flavoprotein|nr:NAD(P)/FAD-dependent oxidoreductase [Lachnospiraceae bacterium]